MRKTIIVTLLLATTFVAGGCISNTKYGSEPSETVGKGAGEGDVIAKHGAPDNIVYFGTQYFNPQTGERGAVDKYLYEYRIGGGSTILGPVYGGDRFSNIAYLIQNGKVLNGGNVGEGSGSYILFGEYIHPKCRAGYGGDGNPGGGDIDLPKHGGLFGLGIGPL